MGYAMLIIAAVQVVSSFYLGWYFIPESGILADARDCMLDNTRFGVEFYYIHSATTDSLFVLSYLCIFKGIYSKNYITTSVDAWIIGAYAFFWLHYVAALSSILNATHTGDLLLTVVVNLYWSAFDEAYRAYYVVFSCEHLNSDQLAVILGLNILTPWYYLYLLQLHLSLSREIWGSKVEEASRESRSGSYVSWLYDTFLKEFQDLWYGAITLLLLYAIRFAYPFISFPTIGTWFISSFNEIRRSVIAPYWYFRPMISLVIMTHSHVEAVFWVCFAFILFMLAPVIYTWYQGAPLDEKAKVASMGRSPVQLFMFALFVISTFYVLTVVPEGRTSFTSIRYNEATAEAKLYTRIVSDFWVSIAMQYIFVYLLWLMHHLEAIDRAAFSFFKYLVLGKARLSKIGTKLLRGIITHSIRFFSFLKSCSKSVFDDKARLLFFKKTER